MASPVSREDLVEAVRTATDILDEVIPLAFTGPDDLNEHRAALRTAAMPVLLRELLDYEVSG